MDISADYQVKKGDLDGKIVLVTGANRGFGKAISLDLAKAGATVIMLSRDLGGLETVYDEIIECGYQAPILYPLDLEGANPDHYQDLLNSIITKFGVLDGLIHNAAILGNLTPIAQYDIKLWYSVLQINLNAAFLLTQALLPALLKSQDARILFITSNVGRIPRAYWGAYGISKSAIETLSKTLAEELEKTQIRTNTVDPQRLKTQMRASAYPAESPQKLPLPKHLSPAIIHLLTPATKHLNGKQLTIIPSF